MRGIYTLTKAITNPSTTNIVIELKGNGSKAYELHRITVTQTGSTTSTNAEIKIQRLSAAGTAGTALADTDFGRRASADGAISLAFGTTSSAYSLGSAGTTTGAPLLDRGWNIVTGFDDYPIPENRIELPADGLLALYLPVAPAGTYIFEITLKELG